MKEHRRWHKIPLYGVNYEVVLTDDLQRSHNRRKFLRRYDVPCNTAGLCSYTFPIFVVFLTRAHTTHNTIAHEVFHAACRMMEEAGVVLTPDNHEPHAHLVGHLAGLTYNALKDWKYRI